MEQFNLKTAVSFGPDALTALEELAGQRVMVITDDFLARSGLLDRVLAHLPGCTVERYTDVVPDPPLILVAQGARKLANFKPQAVVAFGGGSSMDCAKAMVEFGKKMGAPGEIRLYAVPTTAGTGSEVTSFAVLTDSEKGVKYPLVDDSLLPHQAVLDAGFLEKVPPAVTADTGMDVLTHAAEAYVAPWRKRLLCWPITTCAPPMRAQGRVQPRPICCWPPIWPAWPSMGRVLACATVWPMPWAGVTTYPMDD